MCFTRPPMRPYRWTFNGFHFQQPFCLVRFRVAAVTIALPFFRRFRDFPHRATESVQRGRNTARRNLFVFQAPPFCTLMRYLLQ